MTRWASTSRCLAAPETTISRISTRSGFQWLNSEMLGSALLSAGQSTAFFAHVLLYTSLSCEFLRQRRLLETQKRPWQTISFLSGDIVMTPEPPCVTVALGIDDRSHGRSCLAIRIRRSCPADEGVRDSVDFHDNIIMLGFRGWSATGLWLCNSALRVFGSAK